MSDATATVTVFNHDVVAQRPGARVDGEPPVKHVVVVGGGTAGWVTALLLANSAARDVIVRISLRMPRLLRCERFCAG